MGDQRFSVKLISSAVIATLLCAGSVQAQPSHLVELAQAYTARAGTAPRVVVTGPEQRRVNRVFVPVLPSTFEEFHELFTEKNGAVILRYSPAFPNGQVDNHLALAVQAKDTLFWDGLNHNGTDPRVGPHQTPAPNGTWRYHGPGGRMVVARLDEKLAYLKNSYLAPRSYPNPTPKTKNCVEWLPSAEVGPGEGLFHLLGISRSHTSNNMVAKLIHAANDRVELVGVSVQSLEEFQKMSDQELTGPPPAGGVEEAARF